MTGRYTVKRIHGTRDFAVVDRVTGKQVWVFLEYGCGATARVVAQRTAAELNRKKAR